MKIKKNYSYSGYLYILPWILGFLLLQLVPLVNSFWYSFTNFQLLGKAQFLGLDNYKKIFLSDAVFRQSLKVTFYYVLIAVPLKIAFALVIAIILNQNIKGINLFRTLYYIPSILGGSVAISVLWKYLFMNQGVVNNIIGRFGIGAIDWLGDPRLALGTVSLVTIWQFGSSMLLFLAGLKQIPVSLYEAAKIDGAGRMRTFWSITLPELSPIVLFNLIMQMVQAFQEFNGPYIITQGGPLKSTYLLPLYIYDEAFKKFNMGYASAIAWVLFTIITVLTLVAFWSSKKWVYYAGDKRN